MLLEYYPIVEFSWEVSEYLLSSVAPSFAKLCLGQLKDVWQCNQIKCYQIVPFL